MQMQNTKNYYLVTNKTGRGFIFKENLKCLSQLQFQYDVLFPYK